MKKSIEHRARWQLKFLSNWINFWIEMSEEGEPMSEKSFEFALMQIDNLQSTLTKLKERIENAKRAV